MKGHRPYGTVAFRVFKMSFFLHADKKKDKRRCGAEKNPYLCRRSASPEGQVGLFRGKGRLRTFSSVFKLRKLESSRKKRQRERPRLGVLYLARSAFACTSGLCIISSRRGLAVLLILGWGNAKA